MVDRNRAAKDRQQAEFELRQQLQKFARDLAAGQTGMVDRFGAKIEPGDFVLYRPQHDLIFEVLDVAPILDMTAAPGVIKLVLRADTDVQFFASQRSMTLIKCGSKARDVEGSADIKPPGTDAPAEFPPAEPPTDLPAPGQPASQVDEPRADEGGPAPPDVDEVV